MEIQKNIEYDKTTGIFTSLTSGHKRKAGESLGHISNSGYLVIPYKGRSYRANRLAYLLVLGRDPKGVVDHINGDKLDNRWNNLREVSISDNSKNRHTLDSRNKSRLTGVYWDKTKNRWVAFINIEGKRVTLGRFTTIFEAAALRIATGNTLGYTKCSS